jgi:hypothetical protein
MEKKCKHNLGQWRNKRFILHVRGGFPLLPLRGEEGWLRSSRGGFLMLKTIPNHSTPQTNNIRRITSSILYFTSSLLNRMTWIPLKNKYFSRI